MKLKFFVVLSVGLVGGLSIASALLHAQSSAPKNIIDVFTTRGHGIWFSADDVDRDSLQMRLKGHVEIKLFPTNRQDDVMVLHADEADYNKQSDEIIPRGNVRLTIEAARK